MTARRTAFTAVEVIVAIAVLALAVLPVFWTTASGQRNVRLTEYHVLAQARAKRLLEAFSTYGLDGLHEACGGSDGPLPPPLSDGQLDSVSMELPEEYRRKMENFREDYEFETISEDLGLVRVRITWSVAGREHTYQLSRMFGAETLMTSADPPLRRDAS